MADIVVFGAGELAKLARTYIDAGGDDRVLAFAVDTQYTGEAQEFDGLPLIPFERLQELHPPERVLVFVGIGYRRVNRNRAEVYARVKERGYRLLTYVSPRAIVAPDVVLGDNCFVFEGAILQSSVTVGNDTVIWSGACIAHDTTIGHHCFIAPMASISGNVTVGDYAFIGNNATVRDGVSVAERTVVGTGALVKRSTRAGEIYSARGTEAMADRDSSELDDL